MPFIYRGLDAEVLDDYVEIDLQPQPHERAVLSGRLIEDATPSTQPLRVSQIEPSEQIRRRRKLLILGNAGIGKTTFSRHTIITEAKTPGMAPYFYEKERLVPFYVPLKAVDNAEPYPILRYVMKNEPLLQRGKSKKLEAFGQQRRTWFILDGYDEIPFPSSSNHVKRELQLLMNPPLKFSAGEYTDLYRSLANSRVWLTSRREFFYQHPVKLAEFGYSSEFAVGALVLELHGIGDNRKALIERIFGKYSNRRYIKERLSSEYFLQELDSTSAGINELSYNPLFLTVMCYVYVSKVSDRGSHEVDWIKNAVELIEDCTQLLLVDLDDAKARDLSFADRSALRRRRGAYTDEKRAFLPYFAASLYLEAKNVFLYDYLREKARKYFNDLSESPDSPEILSGLERDRPAIPSFAFQLINSGVFILVDRTLGGTLYDFPHRRFREVYALTFFDQDENFSQLLTLLGDPSSSELILFFARQSDRRVDLLTALLDRIRRTTEHRYLADLLLNVIEVWPLEIVSVQTYLKRFFLMSAKASVILCLPEKILDFISEDKHWVSSMNKLLVDEQGDDVIAGQCLACEILGVLNQPLLESTLLRRLEETSQHSQRLHMVFKYLLLFSTASLLERASSLIERDVTRNALIWVVAVEGRRIPDWEKSIESIYQQLEVRDQSVLLSTVRKQNKSFYEYLRSPRCDLGDYHHEVIAIIDLLQNSQFLEVWSHAKAGESRFDSVFLVTGRMLRLVDMEMRKILRGRSETQLQGKEERRFKKLQWDYRKLSGATEKVFYSASTLETHLGRGVATKVLGLGEIESTLIAQVESGYEGLLGPRLPSHFR